MLNHSSWPIELRVASWRRRPGRKLARTRPPNIGHRALSKFKFARRPTIRRDSFRELKLCAPASIFRREILSFSITARTYRLGASTNDGEPANSPNGEKDRHWNTFRWRQLDRISSISAICASAAANSLPLSLLLLLFIQIPSNGPRMQIRPQAGLSVGRSVRRFSLLGRPAGVRVSTPTIELCSRVINHFW